MPVDRASRWPRRFPGRRRAGGGVRPRTVRDARRRGGCPPGAATAATRRSYGERLQERPGVHAPVPPLQHRAARLRQRPGAGPAAGVAGLGVAGRGHRAGARRSLHGWSGGPQRLPLRRGRRPGLDPRGPPRLLPGHAPSRRRPGEGRQRAQLGLGGACRRRARWRASSTPAASASRTSATAPAWRRTGATAIRTSTCAIAARSSRSCPRPTTTSSAPPCLSRSGGCWAICWCATPSSSGRGTGRGRRIPFEVDNGLELSGLTHFDLLCHAGGVRAAAELDPPRGGGAAGRRRRFVSRAPRSSVAALAAVLCSALVSACGGGGAPHRRRLDAGPRPPPGRYRWLVPTAGAQPTVARGEPPAGHRRLAPAGSPAGRRRPGLGTDPRLRRGGDGGPRRPAADLRRHRWGPLAANHRVPDRLLPRHGRTRGAGQPAAPRPPAAALRAPSPRPA